MLSFISISQEPILQSNICLRTKTTFHCNDLHKDPSLRSFPLGIHTFQSGSSEQLHSRIFCNIFCLSKYIPVKNTRWPCTCFSSRKSTHICYLSSRSCCNNNMSVFHHQKRCFEDILSNFLFSKFGSYL